MIKQRTLAIALIGLNLSTAPTVIGERYVVSVEREAWNTFVFEVEYTRIIEPSQHYITILSLKERLKYILEKLCATHIGYTPCSDYIVEINKQCCPQSCIDELEAKDWVKSIVEYQSEDLGDFIARVSTDLSDVKVQLPTRLNISPNSQVIIDHVNVDPTKKKETKKTVTITDPSVAKLIPRLQIPTPGSSELWNIRVRNEPIELGEYLVSQEMKPISKQTIQPGQDNKSSIGSLSDDSVIVALIDTGVDYNHRYLAERCLKRCPDSLDLYGHGTRLAGLIARIGGSSTKILPIRTFDRLGRPASHKEIGKSIKRAVNRGAKVICLAWSGPAYMPYIDAAIHYAQQKGVLCIVSAGNQMVDLCECHVFPAVLDYDNVVIAMAADDKEAITEYTNLWSKEDSHGSPRPQKAMLLGASAHNMITTDLDGAWIRSGGGTSYAAAVLAGAAASLWTTNGSLREVKEALYGYTECMPGGYKRFSLELFDKDLHHNLFNNAPE